MVAIPPQLAGLGASATKELVKKMVAGASKYGVKSPAYKKMVTDLVADFAQKGAVSAGALGMGAVLGAGAVGAYAIHRKGNLLNKDLDTIYKGIESQQKINTDIMIAKSRKARELKKDYLKKALSK